MHAKNQYRSPNKISRWRQIFSAGFISGWLDFTPNIYVRCVAHAFFDRHLIQSADAWFLVMACVGCSRAHLKTLSSLIFTQGNRSCVGPGDAKLCYMVSYLIGLSDYSIDHIKLTKLWICQQWKIRTLLFPAHVLRIRYRPTIRISLLSAPESAKNIFTSENINSFYVCQLSRRINELKRSLTKV